MKNRPRIRLAVATPVVTTLPSAHATWEETGTIEDIARIAETADRLGYHHLTCSEHVGVPATEAPRRGARYWDPLATFGFIAARTQHIRLATNVLVLGYHHPLEIAKRYGTLDVVSGGRLILGLGVGTLREEFDLLAVPFEDRGPRADDALRALRAALSKPDPAYHGQFYDFSGLVVDPCAIQEHVPIWIGGRTLRSLRRAVADGDGWSPFGISPSQARTWLDSVDVPPEFEVVLSPPRLLDPIGAPDDTKRTLEELTDAGATIARCHLVHHSPDHHVDQLEALAALIEGESA